MEPTGQRLGFNDVMKYKAQVPKEHWPYQSISSHGIQIGEIKPIKLDFEKCDCCGGKGTYWQERKPGKFRLTQCELCH